MKKSSQRFISLPLTAALALLPVMHSFAATQAIDILTPGLKLPAPKSPANSGATTSVSPQTGTFHYSYPLVVPPGRAGMEPTLRLTYSSDSPLRGDIATGWSLSLPEISRDSSRSAFDEEAWISTYGGYGRLAPAENPNDANSFRKHGDSSQAFYEKAPSHDRVQFTAYTPDGRTAQFGEPELAPNARQRAPLTSITDRFGNRIEYKWKASSWGDDSFHIESIEYTKNLPTYAPHARVLFIYDKEVFCPEGKIPVGADLSYKQSIDGVVSGYAPLKEIRTEVRDTKNDDFRPVRTISLTYQDKDCAPTRTLASIQESARSLAGEWKSRAPTTFLYRPVWQSLSIKKPTGLFGRNLLEKEGALVWGRAGFVEQIGGHIAARPRDWVDTDSMLIDLDGDGLVERINSEKVGDCNMFSWRRANKKTRRSLNIPALWGQDCSLSVETQNPNIGTNGTNINVIRFLDIDADRLPDIVTAVFIGGSGESLGNPHSNPDCDPNVPNPPDVICGTSSGEEPPARPHIERNGVPILTSRDSQYRDGRYILRWYRNLGDGQFESEPTFIRSPIPLTGIGEIGLAALLQEHGLRYDFIDIDGDTILDAVYANHDQETAWSVWRGDGEGNFLGQENGQPFTWLFPTDPEIESFSRSVSYKLPSLTGSSELQTLLDANADGLVDLIAGKKNGQVKVFYNQGDRFEEEGQLLFDQPVAFSVIKSPPAGIGGITTHRRSYSHRFLDVNGDGLLDRIQSPGIQGRGNFQYHVGNGLGIRSKGSTRNNVPGLSGLFEPAISDAGFWDVSGSFLDVDGDGYRDAIADGQAVGIGTQKAAPGQLVRIKNGQKLTTEITYSPTRNNVGGSLERLHPRFVVSKVATFQKGNPHIKRVEYDYQTPTVRTDEFGNWAFRGFKEVSVRGARSKDSFDVSRFDYETDYRGLETETASGAIEKDTFRMVGATATNWQEQPLTEFASFFAPESRYEAQCETLGSDEDLLASIDRCLESGIATSTELRYAKQSSDGGHAVWAKKEITVTSVNDSVDPEARRTEFRYQVTGKRSRPLLLGTESHTKTQTGEHWNLSQKTVTVYDDGGLGLPKETHTWVSDAEVAVTKRTFDSVSGNVTSQQSPENVATQESSDTTEASVSSFTYDDFGVFITQTINEVGHKTVNQRDLGTGSVLKQLGPGWRDTSEPSMVGTEFSLDGFGRRTEARVRTETGSGDLEPTVVAEWKYDDGEAPTVQSITYVDGKPGQSSTKTTFLNGFGQVISEEIEASGTSPLERRTFIHNAYNNLLEATTPSAEVQGKVVVHTWKYDRNGRLKSYQPPLAGLQTYAYNKNAEIRFLPSGSGTPSMTRTIIRDAFGRVATVQEQSSSCIDDDCAAKWTYGYGPNGHLASIQSPDGDTTHMESDFLGRRTAIHRDGRTWGYVYDLDGNLTVEIPPIPDCATQADVSEYWTQHIYDAAGRETLRIPGRGDSDATRQKEWGLTDPLSGSRSIEMIYDRDKNKPGTLSEVRLPFANIKYSYDASGRVVRKDTDFWATLEGANFSDSFSTRHKWNVSGSPTHIGRHHTDSLLLENEQKYDDRGRLHRIDAGGGRKYEFERNAIGQITVRRAAGSRDGQMEAGKLLGHSLDQINIHDAIGRPLSQTVQSKVCEQVSDSPVTGDNSHLDKDRCKATSILGEQLRYDEAGNVIFHKDEFSQIATEYEYDSYRQLVRATTDDDESYQGDFSYTAAGKLLSASVSSSAIGDNETLYEYEPTWENGKLTSAPSGRVGRLVLGKRTSNNASPTDIQGEASAEYTYDERGNRIFADTKTRNSYSYDVENRLRDFKAEKNGERRIYFYDHEGRRMLELATDSGGTKARVWIDDVEVEYDKHGEITKRLVHLAAEGKAVADIDLDGDVLFLVPGYLGSILGSVNPSGELEARFQYGPWGEVLARDGPGATSQKRQFHGVDVDSLTGLGYYGARYYDKVTRSWTQADPLYRSIPETAMDEPRRMGLYSFNLQNPLRYIDPTGLDPEGWGKNGANQFMPEDVGFAKAALAPPIVKALKPMADTGHAVKRGSIAAFDFLIGDDARAMIRGNPTAILSLLPVAAGKAVKGWNWLRRGRITRRGFKSRHLGAAESPLSIAQRGGRHSGFLEQARKWTPAQRLRSSRNLQKQIQKHEAYIENPISHVRSWNKISPKHQQGLIRHWEKEISNFADQQTILHGL